VHVTTSTYDEHNGSAAATLIWSLAVILIADTVLILLADIADIQANYWF